MKEIAKYKLLSAIRYLGDSFYYPFISLYLVSCNLLESNIGFILSITPLVSIFTNPIYTKLCKNVKATKNILTIITVIEALIIFTISFSSSFYLISVLVFLLALFGTSHYGLMDSLITIFAAKNNESFSKIRIFGSIAYVIGTTAGGYVIKLGGFHLCFGIACILFVLSGFLYYSIKPMEEQQKISERPKYRDLLKNKEYLLFALFYVVFVGMIYASDYFFPVYLETRGITSSQYGLIYSYYVTLEVIVLFLLSRSKKQINNNLLLALATLFMLTRQTVNYLNAPIVIVIIASGFRGISWAIILHISYKYVVDLLGEKLGTIGIMTMTLFQSLLIFILNNVDGTLIERYQSYKPFYMLMIVLAILACIIQIFRLMVYKRKEVNNNEEKCYKEISS
jgi:PPP family 3-phenylpropionic acid transporter